MIDALETTPGSAPVDLKYFSRQKPTLTDVPEADRLPPHAENIEKRVLGCLLCAPGECIPQALKSLTGPEVFYDLRHRTIYQLILEMHDRKEAIDTLTLQQRLKDRQQLEAVGGLAFVSSLPDMVVCVANLGGDLRVVQEKYARRQFIKACQESISAAWDESSKLDTIAKLTGEAVDYIRRQTPGSKQGGLTLRKPSEILALNFDESDCILGDRLLAAGQSLVIAGASGVGKSRLLTQLAACSILGKPFVGMETHGANRKWLLLQAENSNRRLQFDMGKLRSWVGEDAWRLVDASLTVHTLELEDDSFLALDDDRTEQRIADAIEEIKPDIVCFDSLYNFAPGDLNSDADMRQTLTAIARLSKKDNPNRAIIVLHHALTGRAGAAKAAGFDRSSFGRNSKVLHAWTRAQINVAPGEADSNDSLVITCGKNSNGKEFAPFAVCLNGETLIYEPVPDFDLGARQAEMTGKSAEPLMTPDRVRELCKPLTERAELSKVIIKDCGCSRPTAYRHINRAIKAKKITLNKTNDTCSPA